MACCSDITITWIGLSSYLWPDGQELLKTKTQDNCGRCNFCELVIHKGEECKWLANIWTLICISNKALQTEIIMTGTFFSYETGQPKKKLTPNAAEGAMRSACCRSVHRFTWYGKQLNNRLYHQMRKIFFIPGVVPLYETYTHTLYIIFNLGPNTTPLSQGFSCSWEKHWTPGDTGVPVPGCPCSYKDVLC